MIKIMRAFFIIILLFTIVLLMEVYPGRVQFNLSDYHVELPLVGAFLAITLTMWVILILYRAWHFLWTLGARYQRFKDKKKKERGQHLLMDSLSALLAEQPLEARDCARLSSELLPDNAVAEWLFAQTAENDGQAEQHFQKLYENPRTSFMGLKGLIEHARVRQDFKKMWVLLKEAYRLRPDSPWVRRQIISHIFMLSQTDIELKDGVSFVQKIDRTRSDIVQAGLDWITFQKDKSHSSEQQEIKILENVHRRASQWVVPACELAKKFIDSGQMSKAKKVVVHTFSQKPHRMLAFIYADIVDQQKTNVERYKCLSDMTAGELKSYETQYALAQVAIDARLWGPARDHINQLIAHGDTKEACLLMASLVELTQPEDAAAVHEWLRRALECEGSFNWTCQKCYHIQDKWNVLCQNCSEFDTLEWKLSHQPYKKIDYVDIVPSLPLPFNQLLSVEDSSN